MMNVDVRRPLVIVALLALFLLTRGAVFWVTDHPSVYGDTDPTSDVTIYEGWGRAVHVEKGAPYADVPIEYPPGAIPFIVAPSTIDPDGSYRPLFAALMALVDLVGFAALWVMVRRGGSWWALLGWLLVPPLLGPILYSRFDLVPAVAIILALERAQARGWFGVGGWLGFGAVAKLFPAFLAPLAFLVAPKRRLVVFGFGLVAVLMLMPYIGVPRALYDNVFGYHNDRGVQVESLWGSLVLLGDHVGVDSGVAFQFGAMEVYGELVTPFKSISNVLAIVGIGVGSMVAWRWARRDSAADLSLAMLGTLALITGVGRVYSPQYTVWLLAVGAAALALNGRRARWPFLGLVVVTALTAWIFPPLFLPILDNDLWAVLVLFTRNVLTLGVGVVALFAVRRPGMEPRSAAEDPRSEVGSEPSDAGEEAAAGAPAGDRLDA
jgi:hypothetical protein